MGVHSEMVAFLFAAGAVLLAEMGDKSQLLAVAFAARYKPSKVILGVLIASAINLGLAVWIGNLIVKQEILKSWIQAAASLSFVLFGLWTLRGEKEESVGSKKTRFGAVMTVALAFTIAELGDKTQLATVAMATKFPDDPVALWTGAVAGIIAADAIGILVGVVLRKRIHEKLLRTISAAAFIIFGLAGCYEAARYTFGWSAAISAAFVAALAVITAVIAYMIVRKNRENEVVVISGGKARRG
ncbi:MAG: TMEM165/GDT1 family protein [Burkholderiales bacterium]